MKAKIVYISKEVTTVIENSKYDFVEFCNVLFEKKIYLSMAEKGVSIAINTDNIIFVEELK